LDTIEELYKAGVTIREISRRTGVHFSSVRWRLIACGLHRAKRKGTDIGSATCSRCHERKPVEAFPQYVYGN
jgi:transposase-like protein